MTDAKWAAVLSALAGISVLVAALTTFWWRLGLDGRMHLKRWVPVLCGLVIAAQVAALALALTA